MSGNEGFFGFCSGRLLSIYLGICDLMGLLES